jgi:uncharacterized membrane protein
MLTVPICNLRRSGSLRQRKHFDQTPRQIRSVQEIAMNDVIIARALHVLAIALWIGGVSIVTTVVLPAIRRGDLGDNYLQAFKSVESRFVWQARTAVVVAGATGFYMTWRLDAWDRFTTGGFWWMHAMVCVWLLFAFALFVAEPLLLHRHFERWATARPRQAFAWLHRAHGMLLLLSVVTIVGAVAGSQGWSIL